MTFSIILLGLSFGWLIRSEFNYKLIFLRWEISWFLSIIL